MNTPTSAAPPASLDELRQQGAWRFDPTRFRYLEALARRLPGQAPAVQQLLQDKLQAALHAYAQRWAQARQEADAAAARLQARRPAVARDLRRLQAAGDVRGVQRLASSPAAQADEALRALAQLNQYLRELRPADEPAGQAAGPAHAELASVRRFRQAWSRSRAQDQVEQAVARRPSQAGPLNSHALVLESLDLMRSLSPDYLRHFLVHVESLQWLEEARERVAAARSKPGAAGRRGRRKK